ncbi:type VI secretion system protein TssA [Serratia sp. L9]|uniref:type VI secretion system protein TssA n=1 Tax=Serratia sp. L9 TaxID=3423946 RepID=UPI003D66831B
MSVLDNLVTACFAGDKEAAIASAVQQTALWNKWLLPISAGNPVGSDLSYDDRFERMREEVNKISGADTALICQNAEALLLEVGKDVRVATYYTWARLQQDGEAGLVEGLALLAGLITQFGEALYPQRPASRQAAIEWLCGMKIQTTLSLYPEVDDHAGKLMVAVLCLLEQALAGWEEVYRPNMQGLTGMLDTRLAQSGALFTTSNESSEAVAKEAPLAAMPSLGAIRSGRDLLDQAKLLTQYLREQPQGWLSAARVMRSLRWDAVHQIPPQDASGRTRLAPPRSELRATLKRLYLQQSWNLLLEQVERDFAEGTNHFWLDIQWYACQALAKSSYPFPAWGEIIKRDLGMFLERLPGLELQAFNDGTPFADEVTLAWIDQQVSGNQESWHAEPIGQVPGDSNDILALEPEALAIADSESLDAALNWLAGRPGVDSARQRWLLRLMMSRISEQCGKNEMALHLLAELDTPHVAFTLSQWEPALMFEVKARRLKLLRMKAQRGESDKAELASQMEQLLAGLVAIDPARAAVLCH